MRCLREISHTLSPINLSLKIQRNLLRGFECLYDLQIQHF